SQPHRSAARRPSPRPRGPPSTPPDLATAALPPACTARAMPAPALPVPAAVPTSLSSLPREVVLVLAAGCGRSLSICNTRQNLRTSNGVTWWIACPGTCRLLRPCATAPRTPLSAVMSKPHEIRPGQSVELLKALHILTRDGKMNQDSRRKLSRSTTCSS